MNKDIFKWIVLGGLFLVPFVPFMVSSALFFPFITTKAFAWRSIVEIVFVAWTILALMVPEYRPRKSIILYSLFAFICIIGLADLFGMAPAKSFWSNFERMEGFITLLHLGAFFVVIGSVFKEREWKWWWNTSLVASFFMVLYCLGQIMGVTDIHQGGVRVDGSFGNAAYLAVYLLFHIFIALMFLVKERKNGLLAATYGGLILSLLFILYNTATRGAILGCIGGLLIVALLNIRNKDSKRVRKASIALLAGLVVLIGGFYAARNTSFVTSSPVLSRFSTISTASIKTEGRSFVWPMAIKGIKERPLLGWGQENFNYVFNKYYDPDMYNIEPWFDRAHNIFLDWGVAGGVLGLLGYLSLYAALLYSIWKKDRNMSHVDRSILTGLIAAYFFHNLFVFDHLLSYILFISLLAYLHSRTDVPIKRFEKRALTDVEGMTYALPVAVIFISFVLYTVNLKPLMGNAQLINALKATQSETDKNKALGLFTSAYNKSRLGRPETVEWVASSAENVLGSSITVDEKNSYFLYGKEIIERQANQLVTDARYQILAGAYLSKTGFQDEAIPYLERAQILTPGKQLVYFEKGGALIAKGDYEGALKEFETAYTLAPEYQEARMIYLVGAIYANRQDLIQSLITTLPPEAVASDARVTGALLANNRFVDLINLLESRVVFEPTNPDAYLTLASGYLKAGNKAKAIEALQRLGNAIPESKEQADQYIEGVRNGTIQ